MPNETETKQLTKQIRMLPSPACAWPLCLGVTRGKQGQQCCDARVRTSRIDAHIYTSVAPHRVEQAYQNTPSHTRHHHGPGRVLPGCHSHGVTMCGVHPSCTCRENVTSTKNHDNNITWAPTDVFWLFVFPYGFSLLFNMHASNSVQFRAIPFHHQDPSRSFTNPRAILSPPELEPLFHQLSSHSFTAKTRAALYTTRTAVLSPPRFEPFFHHQDSSRSFTNSRAILSPPGLEPVFHHQDSSRSFTNSRAILSPPRLEPVFHHQDSSRSFTTRTRAVLPPQGLVPVFYHQAKFFLVSESTKKQSPTERINFIRSNAKSKEIPKPNGYLLQEQTSKAYKMTITL